MRKLNREKLSELHKVTSLGRAGTGVLIHATELKSPCSYLLWYILPWIQCCYGKLLQQAKLRHHVKHGCFIHQLPVPFMQTVADPLQTGSRVSGL